MGKSFGRRPFLVTLKQQQTHGHGWWWWWWWWCVWCVPGRFLKEAELRRRHKGRHVKLDPACDFSATKWTTTFQNVEQKRVAPSHVLCFYYTSCAQAQVKGVRV